MKEYLLEVQRVLNKQPKKTTEDYKIYHKNYRGSDIPTLGLDIKTADARKLTKNGYSFYTLPKNQIDAIWDFIWKNAKWYEEMDQCLYYYQMHKTELSLSEWKILKGWSSRIENWAHSDMYCDLISSIFENHPKEIYPQLQKWNQSSNPWLRRISIVSTFYYASSRKKRQPKWNEVFPLIKSLFFDTDTYVQKGVGWTLRELYNVYPDQTWRFLESKAKEIHPIAWQASTEKLNKKQKDLLKKLRSK